jgi:hypothetical protein
MMKTRVAVQLQENSALDNNADAEENSEAKQPQ